MSKRRARINAQLDAVYAELPKLACKGRCQDYCGPVPMATEEWERVIHMLGRVPQPTSLECPLLTKDGRCSVYQIRPMICRLWGVVENMRCPWGCLPTPRYLTPEEGHAFMLRSGITGSPWPKHEAEAFIRMLTPDQRRDIREIMAGVPPRLLTEAFVNHAGPFQEAARGLLLPPQ